MQRRIRQGAPKDDGKGEGEAIKSYIDEDGNVIIVQEYVLMKQRHPRLIEQRAMVRAYFAKLKQMARSGEIG